MVERLCQPLPPRSPERVLCPVAMCVEERGWSWRLGTQGMAALPFLGSFSCWFLSHPPPPPPGSTGIFKGSQGSGLLHLACLIPHSGPLPGSSCSDSAPCLSGTPLTQFLRSNECLCRLPLSSSIPKSLCSHAQTIIIPGHLFPTLNFSSSRKFCLIFGALPTCKLLGPKPELEALVLGSRVGGSGCDSLEEQV